jgi:hypothetical protein
MFGPLFVMMFTGSQGAQFYALSLPERLESLEGADASHSRYSSTEITVLAFSFVVALVAYGVFHHKRPAREYVWDRSYPF